MNYIGEALQLLNEEYISENAVGTPSSITIDGKSYPIKSKEFLDGKLAGAGRGFGLEHVLNVKYKGHSYKIYDTGFSNMSSKDRCAILDESCSAGELGEGIFRDKAQIFINDVTRKIYTWLDKYSDYYNYWRKPEKSDLYSSYFKLSVYPETFEKAKILWNALSSYVQSSLGLTIWGGGYERSNPGVVTLNINIPERNRRKCKAYEYSFNFGEELKECINPLIEDMYERDWYRNSDQVKTTDSIFDKVMKLKQCLTSKLCSAKEQQALRDIDKYLDSLLSNFNSENLDEGIFDKIKSSFGRKPNSYDDWKQCLDKGYITWDQIYAANKKAEARKKKEWKANGSNMTYQDYKNVSRGL